MWTANCDPNSNAIGPKRSLSSGDEITLSFSWTEYFWCSKQLPDCLHLYQFLSLLICFFSPHSQLGPLSSVPLFVPLSVCMWWKYTRVSVHHSLSAGYQCTDWYGLLGRLGWKTEACMCVTGHKQRVSPATPSAVCREDSVTSELFSAAVLRPTGVPCSMMSIGQ